MFLRPTFLTILFAFSAVACGQDSPVKSNNSDKPKTSEKSGEQDPGKAPQGDRDKASQADRDKASQADRDKASQADRESREIFFRTFGETRTRGAQEFSFLLFQESVRKEIGLSDESAKAAREVLFQTRASAEKLYEQLQAKEITGDELKVKMLEINTKADRDIWKILGDSNAKIDRLIGLFVQHRQCSSVLNKVVAEKVGLDESRRHEIIKEKETIERKMFEDRSRDAQSPSDRFRAWEKVQKKIDGSVSEMLTQEQRDKLESLKGKPFKFEEFPLPPGPPGRGREGGRDRNHRENGHDEKCKDCEKLANDR